MARYILFKKESNETSMFLYTEDEMKKKGITFSDFDSHMRIADAEYKAFFVK